MIKRRALLGMFAAAVLLSACASKETQSSSTENGVLPEKESEEILAAENMTQEESLTAVTESIEAEEEGSSRILIAYFTRLDNTEADLDTIVQGGGPYGEIGNSFADADLDAISSASITIKDGVAKGNTQVVAETIQELTGADLFSIRTIQSYPVDYDELIDLGGEEENADARPELAELVENMETYDIVFLGFPNWWYDMPMALYSFLDAHDLSGKTIIPFATSASSGFSNTIAAIRELEPQAEVVENGLAIPMREVGDSAERIAQWVEETLHLL